MFKTKADLLVELTKSKKQVSVDELTKLLESSRDVIIAHAQYLEQAGIVRIEHKPKAIIRFIRSAHSTVQYQSEQDVMNRIKILIQTNNMQKLKNMLYDMYFALQHEKDEHLEQYYRKAHAYILKYLKDITGPLKPDSKDAVTELITEIEEYKINLDKFFMHAHITKQAFELVPYYILSVVEYGPATAAMLEQIKNEIIRNISIASLDKPILRDNKIRDEFRNKLTEKLNMLMPEVPHTKLIALTEYIVMTTFGMGDIEVLLHDPNIEEVVVNASQESVWIYHKKHSWLKTNIIVPNEDTIKHYATLAGRLVNKNITILNPLLDASLASGDRINATLQPISTKGNTLTIRKFSSKPWTITNLLDSGTLDYDTAALIWFGVQYELSLLIVGGTGSGKTSTLNVISNFFPPNQRIISIEDTRELILPDTLHWVPMASRLANPEGEGAITMLDLLVNALRQRPDRILIGEIRRKAEAEVMFEAMHTGHSVYATLHANSVSEAIMRLTNPPIDLPKTVLNALSLIIVQNRNRRTGKRRTFQVAEILESGDANLLMEHNVSKDKMEVANAPIRLYETLKLFSGLTKKQIDKDLNEKIMILKHMVKNKIDDVHEIGSIVSDYYSNKWYLFKRMNHTPDKDDA